MQSRGNRNRPMAIFAVLLLLSMACSFSASTDEVASDSPDLAATQASLEATQAALDSAQADAEAAAAAEAEAEAQAQAEAEQESEPPPEAESDEPPPYFLAEWDSLDELDWWVYELTSGDDNDWDLIVDGGTLTFDLQGEYIWPYLFYDAYDYADVRLDMEVRNIGANNNNVSLICRDNERGWYEFNIANNGLYWILRYDRTTGEYTQLYNGGSEAIRVGKDTNWYTAICEGTSLTLGVNGTDVRTVNDTTFVDGRVGVSVSSFDITPVIVEVNWLQIDIP